MQTVETKYGAVKIKMATWRAGEKKQIINLQPEYEDCANLARQHNIPWQEIHRIALLSLEDGKTIR